MPAAALVATLLLASGCAGEAEPADPVEATAHALATLRRSATVALPVDLPPGLQTIHAATGDGLPLVTFYSTNQPLVTVCSGPLARCQALTEPRATLQRLARAATSVLVTVDASEAPEDALPLSRDLRSFWSGVELTTAQPDWLQGRS